MTAFDMYVDRDTTPEAIVKMSQDEIEADIAAQVRESALDSEPDASDAEINTATEDAAHDILMEARRRVLVAAIANGEDVVLLEMGCPECEETRSDELVWQSDEEVIECATCGATYTLD